MLTFKSPVSGGVRAAPLSLYLSRAVSAAALAAAVLVAGCEQQQQEAQAPSPPQAKVSVVTLHPRAVVITAELPGRTSASLVAEVRPQVSGIIMKRLFKEGSEVAAGDPLYQIDPASYQAAYDSDVANMKKAEAAVPSAQAQVERYKLLIKKKAVSEQAFDDAQATLDEAKAEVAVAKAGVESARINLGHTTIRAPISGRVDASSVTVGALVTANQTTALTTIRKLDPINVDVTQSSTNLLRLRNAIRDGQIKTSGPNVSVRLKLEDGSMYSYTGTLEFSESTIDKTTGTYTVRAEFPNPDRFLLPGMYVRGIIEEGVAENSFLVPQRGVTRNAKGEATAKFVNAEGQVEQRVLNIERNIGNNWLIGQGVADGDRLIVEGAQFVRSGQKVTIVEAQADDGTAGSEQSSQKSSVKTPSKAASSGQSATADQT